MEKNLCGENLCGEKMTNMMPAPKLTEPNLLNQIHQSKPNYWVKQSTPGSVVPLAMFSYVHDLCIDQCSLWWTSQYHYNRETGTRMYYPPPWRLNLRHPSSVGQKGKNFCHLKHDRLILVSILPSAPSSFKLISRAQSERKFCQIRSNGNPKPGT